MNVQDYISSGIIESYVLGLASPEEQAEFESMCAQHPEILQARLSFEISLEQQAMAGAVLPPPELKEKIRAALFEGQQEQAPVIKMQGVPAKQDNFWKYAAAASVLLLVGSVIWNISLIDRNKGLKDEVEGANSRLAQINQQVDTIKRDMAVMTENPNMRMAVMKGLEPAPQAFATVYWDTTSHDVYLAAKNLPVPASDKQYQLWAIFNGKPVDLGVFDIREEKLLIRAKNAQGAEAFAITLEDRGGSDVPKGKMYVMGKM